MVTKPTDALTFRRMRAGEQSAVMEVFEGLSERSRRLRFHTAKPRLTERELAALTSVGSSGREAVVAVEQSTGRVVGIARFIADASDEAEAEVGYAVVDEWQHRGLGRRLIVELGRLADWQGVRRFRGLVVAGNAPALALLSHIGRVVERRYESGAIEVVVEIRP